MTFLKLKNSESTLGVRWSIFGSIIILALILIGKRAGFDIAAHSPFVADGEIWFTSPVPYNWAADLVMSFVCLFLLGYQFGLITNEVNPKDRILFICFGIPIGLMAIFGIYVGGFCAAIPILAFSIFGGLNSREAVLLTTILCGVICIFVNTVTATVVGLISLSMFVAIASIKWIFKKESWQQMFQFMFVGN